MAPTRTAGANGSSSGALRSSRRRPSRIAVPWIDGDPQRRGRQRLRCGRCAPRRRATARGPRPARGVLFIAFTGEESGLLGSSHFLAHPTTPGTIVGDDQSRHGGPAGPGVAHHLRRRHGRRVAHAAGSGGRPRRRHGGGARRRATDRATTPRFISRTSRSCTSSPTRTATITSPPTTGTRLTPPASRRWPRSSRTSRRRRPIARLRSRCVAVQASPRHPAANDRRGLRRVSRERPRLRAGRSRREAERRHGRLSGRQGRAARR